MCKVVIDAFETEQDAIAFVSWLKQKCAENKVIIVTTDGLQEVCYDGMDEDSSTHKQVVVNITQVSLEE